MKPPAKIDGWSDFTAGFVACSSEGWLEESTEIECVKEEEELGVYSEPLVSGWKYLLPNEPRHALPMKLSHRGGCGEIGDALTFDQDE